MQGYSFVLLLVLIYLWQRRGDMLGASMAFLYLLLIFHGPMLFVYTEVWGGGYEFGQLPHLVTNVATSDVIQQVYLGLTACVLFVLVGVWLYNFTHPRIKILSRKHTKLEIRRCSIPRILLATQISAICILIFLLLQFALAAPPTELFRYYLSSIDEFEKVGIRRSATLSFYPYQVLMTAFFPFLSFVLVAQSNQDSNSAAINRRVKFYAIFFTSLVMCAKLAQYNKSGPVFFALQLLFVTAYARSLSFRLHAWHLKIFGIGLLSIIAITSLVNSTGSWILTLFSAFERTFMIPNEVIFEYFAVIPERLPHGFGKGISWIAAFIGDNGSDETLGTYWKVGAIVRDAYGSTSNSFFIADAWAEFSWLGVVFFSLAAGWIIRWHDHQVMRWGSSPVALALLVSGYYGAYTLATTALTTALFTGGLVVTPVIAVMLFRKKTGHGVNI